MWSAIPRSCIYLMNHINDLPLFELCSKDITLVRITYSRGGKQKLSMWLQHTCHTTYSDKLLPIEGMREVNNCCNSRWRQLIIGCDANTHTHHILQGTTDINQRTKSLMEYLVNSKLNLLNRSNEPTSMISNSQVVINILRTNPTGYPVRDWHASDEP
jgi:hypothetical protein